MRLEDLNIPGEGQTIGNFRLEKMLRLTYLGVFYLARNERGEPVTLLVLPPKLIELDPKLIVRYRKTIEALAGVSTEGLLKPTGLLQAGKYWVITHSQPVEESVATRVESSGPLSGDGAVSVLKRISLTLEACVKWGIHHLFLSPDFIFSADGGRILVGGVGLFEAIAYDQFERYISGVIHPILTEDDKAYTPLEILSPEIRDTRRADPRSEFYCLGMTGYFLAVGYKPVRAWKLPSVARPELGKGWDLFLSHCLEQNPRRRFPSHGFFQADLDIIDNLDSADSRDGKGIRRIISRLPLPARFQEILGLRKLFYLRVALVATLFGLSGVVAILFSSILFTNEVDELDLDWVELVSPENANIRLQTDPDRVWVIFPGRESERFEVLDGNFAGRFIGIEGEVQVGAPGFVSQRFAFDLKENKVFEKWVRLSPNTVSLRIRSLPGSEVSILDEGGNALLLGEVGADGELSLAEGILAGKHRFRVRAPGYHDWESEPMEILGGSFVMEAELQPMPGKLTIDAPEEAEVISNGERVGTTPLVLNDLRAGSDWEIVLRVEGKRDQRYSRSIDPGGDHRIEAEAFSWKEGEIRLSVLFEGDDPPPDDEVVVYLNDRDFPLQDAYTVRAGSLDARVEHPDYLPVSETLEIRDGDQVEKSIKLKPRPARLDIFMDTDIPYRLYLNDDPVDWQIGKILELPPFEVSSLRVVVRNHYNVEQKFRPGANELVEWDIPLVDLPGPEFGLKWEVPYVGIQMVWIEAGEFEMGSQIQELRRLPNEDQQTRIKFGSPFWIGETEITQSQWRRVMGSVPSRFRGDLRPVEQVNWAEALAFTERLTERERESDRLPPGMVYRLPTEAEWEYAARAGTETPFHFGSRANRLKGNFEGVYPRGDPEIAGDSAYGTENVGEYSPNSWGLHDVHGNVAEWTLDVFWDRLPGGELEDYVRLGEGDSRSVRGGSWQDSAHRVRSAARTGMKAGTRSDAIGFRIVLAKEVEGF